VKPDADERRAAILAGHPIWDAHLGDNEPMPLMWKWLVLQRDGGCQMNGVGRVECDGDLEGHHIITQQQLRKVDATEEQRWDVRNGMALCERHHRRHTRALERVPFHLLRLEAFEFAEELKVGWLLAKYYPQVKEAA
jgi:hypothetical protein